MRTRRIPGQEYFNGEFQERLGLLVRREARRKRSVATAVAVIAIAYLAGVSWLLFAAIGLVILVVLLASRDAARMTPAQSAPPRPVSDNDGAPVEYVEGGAGDVAYERARVELRALVGQDVSVVVAGPGNEPVATLDGRLHTPTNISSDEFEVLSFPVGAIAETAACFQVSRALFLTDAASMTRMPVDGSLRLNLDGLDIWVFERTPAVR